jgi:thioester reductase-like protein
MMPTIFFTGFPGFLGVELLPRLLQGAAGDVAVCLVQPKFAAIARARVEQLERRHSWLGGRLRLLEGDITKPRLGIHDMRAETGEVVEIFHLAAVYDLSVPRDLAHHVNVLGTRHVLDFAADCPNLRRFQYISTCYVSGRYAGVFRESDLDRGQEFHNFYEETKFHAEVEVQKRMHDGLPATIYRPAIVVGDSATGATQKYDGPYFIIRWILRQRGIAFVPIVGDPTAHRVNVVPRDFVVDALAHLARIDASRGTIYQLADPEPLTVAEMIDAIQRATRQRVLRIPLPLGVAKAAIDWVPLVERLMQIPSSAVDYFVHPAHYTCDNTQRDLAGSGIEAPGFASYVGKLVEFVRKHPGLGSEAMV